MHGNRHELVTWSKDMWHRKRDYKTFNVKFMLFSDLSPHLDESVSAGQDLSCVWRLLHILGKEMGGWCEAVYLNMKKEHIYINTTVFRWEKLGRNMHFRSTMCNVQWSHVFSALEYLYNLMYFIHFSLKMSHSVHRRIINLNQKRWKKSCFSFALPPYMWLVGGLPASMCLAVLQVK